MFRLTLPNDHPSYPTPPSTDQGRDIRLPSAVMETIQKLTRIQSELQRPAVTDESVDYADLARAAGMPLERVMFFMSIATPPVHLGQNEELRGREDGSDYNFLQDIETQGPSIEDELTEEENRLFLLQVKGWRVFCLSSRAWSFGQHDIRLVALKMLLTGCSLSCAAHPLV